MITDLRMVKINNATVLEMLRNGEWVQVQVVDLSAATRLGKKNRSERLEDALRRSWDYARGNVNQPPDELRREVEELLKGVPDRRK